MWKEFVYFIILQYFIVSVISAYEGNMANSGYWVFAALLNISVLYMN